MKKIALIAAALLAAGVAQAQTKAAAPAVYGELGYVFLSAQVPVLDLTRNQVLHPKANPTAVRGILGVDLHPYVAIEAMVAGGASDDELGDFANKVKVKSSYGAFIKPKYALDDKFEVFGRIGYAKTKGEMTVVNGSVTTNEGDVAWGLGASYKFNKQWYGSMDYTNYLDKDGVKVDGFAINVGYRF
ncbi:porin family protein [Roseateles depolymerans]|uniref:Uncharacterized protein n=1 Tax=Roseateles depolymerans TaxID=76731 RepID=A0A0U3CWL5_9BURK|nr:porin family protein [Roseateles depolymerans]ALV05734.1 hypothetical protein RD2015_1243 [Roseateles depolymerans]REG12996.1 opacity protein-like surface antigen [Roseateles depolymerans]